MEHASSENERFKAEQDYSNGRIGFVSIAMALGLHGMIMMDLKCISKRRIYNCVFSGRTESTICETVWRGNIKLSEVYDTTENAGNILLKYMVHMKTQQSFARNEGDQEIVERIQQWFDRFESALQVLLDEKSIHLEYDYKIIILKSDRKVESLLNSVNCQMVIHR